MANHTARERTQRVKQADVVVIGGSAAGIPAAVTCRRHYPEKTVLMVRREKQTLIPCGIPYIFGTVGSPENDLIPDAVLELNGIGLLVDEASGIDRINRIVMTAGGERVGYDRLVLATGSEPMVPPIPGVDLEGISSIVDAMHRRNKGGRQLRTYHRCLLWE